MVTSIKSTEENLFFVGGVGAVSVTVFSLKGRVIDH
jgi:hypothetical protein